MITWYEKLMIHNSIENIDDIKNQINNKEYPLGIYCIIDSLNHNNLFEIVSSNELSNSFYDELKVHVIGIAKGKKNINDVLIKLVESIVDENGLIDKSLLYVQGGD